MAGEAASTFPLENEAEEAILRSLLTTLDDKAARPVGGCLEFPTALSHTLSGFVLLTTR